MDSQTSKSLESMSIERISNFFFKNVFETTLSNKFSFKFIDEFIGKIFLKCFEVSIKSLNLALSCSIYTAFAEYFSTRLKVLE